MKNKVFTEHEIYNYWSKTKKTISKFSRIENPVKFIDKVRNNLYKLSL